MLTRLVFSLVLGLLMYVPRPVPRPPVDTVPSTPEELPPGGDGDGMPSIDPPEMDVPGRPIPMPEIELPDWPTGRPGGHVPSLPPTPPPGFEGEWPPASERPDVPPTPPPGHDGPWSPGHDSSFRERIREIIRELQVLLSQDRPAKAVGDADEGVKRLGLAPPAAEGSTTLDA